METADYLLYDNRTWSASTGGDWGLKAATGALAGDSRLQRLFIDYCRATSAQGHPRGFGAALGGLRPPMAADGYLLCVTLETLDLHDRPSWVVVGLFLVDRRALEVALTRCDSITSARGLLAPTKPTRLTLVEASQAGGAEVARAEVGLERLDRAPSRRFRGVATLEEVRALLLARCRQGEELPSILGVTMFHRLDARPSSAFERVYFLSADPDAEVALETELALERMRPPRSLDHGANADPFAWKAAETRSVYWRLEPVPRVRAVWTRAGLAAALLLLLLAGWLLWARRSAPPPGISSSETTSADVLDPDESRERDRHPNPTIDVGEADAHERSVRRFEVIFHRFRALDRRALESSRPYSLAQSVPVAPRFAGRRQRVLDTFAALAELQALLTGLEGDTAYPFVEGSARQAPFEARHWGLLRVLTRAPMTRLDCALLRRTFRFDVERSDSQVAAWCDAADALQQYLQDEMQGRFLASD